MPQRTSAPPNRLELGREAFDLQAWADVVDHLVASDRDAPLGLEDLERLAQASYLTGRYAESMELSRRSYRESMRAGDVGRAARSAFWVAIEHLGQGEMAPAAGWLAKAERLVGKGESAESGYLHVAAAAQSMAMGDPAAALSANERAVDIGTRFGDPDLVVLAGVGVGESLIGLGEVDRGIRQLDEVMVDVTSGGASAVIVGIAYCSVIAACHQVFDLRRAQEWTATLDRWCESQPQLVHFRGQCLLNRAELRRFHGAWDEAASEAREASERLAQPHPDPSLGEAIYQMAELHRLRGDFADAEAAYRQASRLGRPPEPGIALLRLARGQSDIAAATMARATDEAIGVFARTPLLDPLVEVLLATGSTAAARMAADELLAVAKELGAPLLRAMAKRADGAVLMAEGDPRAALIALRASWAAWSALDAPYEAARARVLIGLACRALDDADAAALEFDAAAGTFHELGARPDLARVEALMGGRSAPQAHGLTPREVEVLRLVAAGKTNRAIADELVISERTVGRHLSNIFDKLGVPSRAAATAWAYENGLVARSG